MSVEKITYNGTTYRRYPNSRRYSDRAYFKATPGRLLHVEMYKAEVGPIPEGHEVHHRDFCTTNNTVGNFELVTANAHKEIHRQRLREKAIERNQIAVAQAAAKEWHGSATGREWHRAQGKASWDARKPVAHVCEECGTTFTSKKTHNVRFCHPNCRAKAFRKRHRA